MARSNSSDNLGTDTEASGGRFDPEMPLITASDLPAGWTHDSAGSVAATAESHGRCVHYFTFEGPYTVRVVQVREANEYSVQREQTASIVEGNAPNEDVFAASDPGGLDESVAAARRMMAEVTTYYTEITP